LNGIEFALLFRRTMTAIIQLMGYCLLPVKWSETLRNTMVFLISCLLISSALVAQPSISSIDSTIEQGEEITLSGIQFSAAEALPFSWDNFESGNVGSNLGSPDIGPTWTFLSQLPMPSYSSTEKYSGEKAAHITWQSYSISSFGWSNKGPFDSIYITFWRFMDPMNTESLPNNFKMLYLYGTASGEIPQFMIGAIMPSRRNWQFATQPSPTVNYPWDISNSYFSTNGQWQRWELYVQLDSPYSASNGEFEGWLDGQKVIDRQGVNLTDVNGVFEDLRIGHMFQGHTNDDHCYYDDVYISRSRARVEIGNNQDFNNCTLRNVQIPSIWTDQSITFETHIPGFENGEEAWMFVIDEDGNASEGYPVTIGGQVELPPGTPGQPVR
jgi:hypothetical protein